MNISITSQEQVNVKYISRRVAAYFVDITILAVAVQVFQWALSVLTGGFPFDMLAAANSGWLIYGWTFFSVSLPIWLYFVLSEGSERRATVGKRLFKLQVVATTGEKASWRQLLGRTVLKLVPWEIFHLTFMLPAPLYSDAVPTFRPGFVIGAVVLGLYLLVLIQPPGMQSIHDLVARTAVTEQR